jgi:hypothetical protein
VGRTEPVQRSWRSAQHGFRRSHVPEPTAAAGGDEAFIADVQLLSDDLQETSDVVAADGTGTKKPQVGSLAGADLGSSLWAILGSNQ